MRWDKIHQCSKSQGKVVAIGLDTIGNAYCKYCGERVDYFSSMHDEEV